MIDGIPLIDVHLRVARLSGLRLTWDEWVHDFDTPELRSLWDGGDIADPGAFDAYLAREGVDVAVVLSEYSPKVTGTQSVEDMLPLTRYNPHRVKVAANVNPHLHYPPDEELERQVALGAVALKVHPVHAGFPVNDRTMYPAYEICQAAGIPVIVHSGTSTFPGAMNRYGDPLYIDDLLRDFRSLDVVLAHGGRGWWYDAAAFMALSNEHVWLELSGLPPTRLQGYYAKHNWTRLTRRMIFGTGWPGIPGINKNARAIAQLCPNDDTRQLVLSGNASQVYNLKIPTDAGA